ncbi:uncharacterized protein ALTATR162_LOCUS5127 [Alternaria atra]|uniref:Uncharacterized protein n=1 Tax=Alternaria atra TaxID=119953 RepID=A0A8J2HZU4_9PLEO|nr:uncharacterized protein ALTATR162_LOCUS5127 [Alternaria atra]CAG5158531.1 unnamed protein product [Alternaria atra]
MQNDTPHPQQVSTPAPIPPIIVTAPETHITHTPKKATRKKPMTTSNNLTVFEPRLFALMPEAVAKELINTMRLILTVGGRKQRLLNVRRQKIKDLLQKLNNNEVIKVYSEFASAHEQAEERLTFKLPLIEELDGGDEEVKELEEAHDDIESHDAQEETIEDQAAFNSKMQEKSGLGVTQNPDVDMEGIPSPTLQGFATRYVNSETAPSPSVLTLQLPLIRPIGVACEKHTNGTCTVIPIQNPEAFPKMDIQEVQAKYYPAARFIDMCMHRDENNEVTQVTATLDKGPVDHLIINDTRIINLLGLHQSPYDTICLQHNPRFDETYQIHVQPGQAPHNPKAWIVGELASARHPYLYWLDSRQNIDPRAPPIAAEIKTLAPKIGRRAWDVWREIEKYWNLEQGSGGRHYRENRMVYLGKDPTYGKGEERRSRRSMWR